MNTQTMTHLGCLNIRLSNERERLNAATSEKEIAYRKVLVAQIEREISAEIDFCYPEADSDLTDEELLMALEG
jgi:hypothetical protein